MASRSALLAVLVAVSCAAAASAASFTVGGTQGWTQGVDYNTWASGQTFAEGDTLVFNFPANAHDVAEVDKSGYDGCSSSSASNTITTSPANVKLTSGTHYYICTFPGHCSNGGMKLAVTVGSGSGSGSPPSTPPSTPGTPSTPPSTPSPRPSGASARLTAGPALAVAAGVLLKLAMF